MIIRTTEVLAPQKHILAMPDHYVNIGFRVEKATAAGGMVTQDENTGRFMVRAGTPYPANDATAIGLVFNDYDVTDEDKNIAVMIHGFVQRKNVEENAGVTITAEAKAAMKQITILDEISE